MSTVADELKQIADDLCGSFDSLKERLDEDHGRLDAIEGRLEKAALGDFPKRPGKEPAEFLTLEQKTAPRLLERLNDVPEDYKEIRFGALIAARAGGQKVLEQLNDAEQKAVLNTVVSSSGGFLVPEAVGALFIDSVRPRTRVLQAGARTYPMEASIVHLPGWDDLLTAAWRGEQGAFPEAAPKFLQVTLEARSVATRVRISVELLEDAEANLGPVAEIIEREIGRAIAEAIDYAALLGSGVDNQPLGLMSIPTLVGMNEVSMGTNGATPADWDKFLDALYELEADAFEATGVIWHPRTPHTLSKIKTGLTGDLTKLVPPPRIAELPKFATTQVPITQTQGSATDASTAFFGDWRQLVIGVRPEIAVRTQTDPYTEGASGIVNIYAYARADVAALFPQAFCRLVGIKG